VATIRLARSGDRFAANFTDKSPLRKEKILQKIIARFVREDQGAAGVEYGLLVALIAAVIVTVVGALGTQVQKGFQKVCTALNGNAACAQ